MLSFPPTSGTAALVPPTGYVCALNVRTKPTFWVDGEPASDDLSASLLGDPSVLVSPNSEDRTPPVCKDLLLRIETIMPLGATGSLGEGSSRPGALYSIHAGGTFALALDAHTAGSAQVLQAASELSEASRSRPLAEDDTATYVDLDGSGTKGPGERYLAQDFESQEALLGGLLHLANTRFFDLARGGEELARELHHQMVIRFPGTGLVLGGIRPISLMGAPAAVISNQLVIDVKANVSTITNRRGGLITAREPSSELAGHHGSAAEHAVWEELAGVEAVSTVKGFQLGFAQGQELLVLRSHQEAQTAIESRCGSQTCTGLDQIAYCEIRRAFRLGPHAASWDPGCVGTIAQQPPARDTEELRIHACANLGHLGWTGSVFYESFTEGLNFGQFFSIQPISDTVPVCAPASQTSGPSISGPMFGGGFVMGFEPFVPLSFDFTLNAPPPPVENSFINLDLATFGTNSFALNTVLAGDPVSVVSGNNQHTELDLRIAGRGGHDLRVLRSYNSRLRYDGPLGYGWTHTLDQHLVRFPGEDSADPNDDLVLWRTEQGNEVRFEQTPEGLVSEVGVYDRLVRDPDGSYTLTLKQGGVLRFASDDSQGRANLLELRDRSGNRIVCTYVNGVLTTARDTAGRALTFGYDAAGRVEEMRDWTGRRWLYEVDANGDLVSFMDPVQVVAEQAVPGSGRRTLYTYDSGMASEALNHNLRCWIRPRGDRAPVPEVPELCGPEGRGHAWMHFSYAPTDSVASHTDSLGRTTTFSFNFFRRRSYVNHPDGTSERYVFDRIGNVIRHETARGVIRRFEFKPGTRNKTREWDGHGNLTVATYDDRGDLRVRTDRRGNTETWTYDDFGQPTSHTDRRGNQKRWEYDPVTGVLQREFGTLDTVEVLLRHHSYDPVGNRKTTTAFTQPGQVGPRLTQFFYNGSATSLVSTIDGEGNVTTIQPDALGRPVREERTRTTASGALETVVTARCYDGLDRVRRTIDPIGTVRRVAYDADGAVIERATVSASEISGDPCLSIPPGRIDEERLYDAFGRLVESRDAFGKTTHFGYDGRDRLTERTRPSGSTEHFSYDADGNLAAVTDASGRTVRFEYDAEDRLVRSVDPLGRVMKREYDTEGNEVRRWEPKAVTAGNPEGIRIVFDALEVDENGNVMRFRNAAGSEFLRSFDELGRLRAFEGPLGLPESARTEFRYDLLGQQTDRIDGEGEWTTTRYDLVGRIDRTVDALNRETAFGYDEVGNLVSSRDAAGLELRFEYDARGLLLGRSGPGVDDRYTYDELGRQQTATNAVSSHRFGYDARDRMVEHYGSRMGTARMIYDEDGLATQLVYPSPPGAAFAQTPVTTFQYDPAGRVTSIHDSGQFASPGQDRMWAWGFVWDGAGRLADRLDPRGVRAATRYTPEGWVDDITVSYPDLPDETVDYNSYDALGSPLRIDFPEGITRPVFDARSRVTGATHQGAGANEEFDYDLDGNRVRHKMGFNRRFVVEAADQLAETRRVSDDGLEEQFFYDAAGRRKSRLDVATGVVTGYAYDALGRLTAVVDTTGYELSLEYDPLGGRIRRTETQPGAASETTLFLAGLVELRDVDAAGQAAEVVRWIPGPGPGGVVAEVSAGSSAQAPVIWSLIGDAADNVVRMTRVDVVAGGALATTRATVRYAAFGQEIQASGSAPTGRRFAGMLHEGTSGLVHMGARHYDPRTGAFLQPDPLGIAAVQTYAYAANNPYRFVDPSGLDPFSIAGDFGFSFPMGGSGFVDTRGFSPVSAPSTPDRSGEFVDFVNDIFPDQVVVGGLTGFPLVVGGDLEVDTRDITNPRLQNVNLRFGFGGASQFGIRSLSALGAVNDMRGPQFPVQFGAIVAGQLPGTPFGAAVDFRVGFDLQGSSVSGGFGLLQGGAVCAPCVTIAIPLNPPVQTD